MDIDRRTTLKLFTGTAAFAVASKALRSSREGQPPPSGAYGLLYDSTLCIGCKTCEVACNRANNLPVDTGKSNGLYQAPPSLNARTKNVIKVYEDPKTGEYAFMKQQCMHCLDPACVAGCPMGALSKGEHGIVSWNGRTCIGCRYCQMACPYNTPKFEWLAVNPKIVKCELCKDRLAQGGQPACAEVCPRKAVIFGLREDLLNTARQRILDHPGKYYADHIYGEREGGGTQVLYLSHVPFEKLGLPQLGDASLPSGVRSVQEAIYHGFLTPVFLYGILASVMKKRWAVHEAESERERLETGREKQL